jgi:hypothetical protein
MNIDIDIPFAHLLTPSNDPPRSPPNAPPPRAAAVTCQCSRAFVSDLETPRASGGYLSRHWVGTRGDVDDGDGSVVCAGLV